MAGELDDLLVGRSRDELKTLFAWHVSAPKVAFFDAAGIDFVLGRREGPYLYDLGGTGPWIDCHCNGGVFNLGHRNLELVDLLKASLDRWDIGNHHLLSAPRAVLAAKLAELTPGHLPYTVFAVSGGEAMDLAVKLARGFTKRRGVVSAMGGYHGHTGFALAAGDPKYREPFMSSLPEFTQVPFGSAGALEATLGPGVAAVVLETVPATLGMPVAEPAYFRDVRRLCDRHGCLLILDEVQAGLGRTGRLWAAEHFGVEPDLLVLGKGLSGGLYPMAATCVRREVMSLFESDPFLHISTFGGAEVGCALALRVLEISAEPAFLAHVRRLGEILEEGFVAMAPRHPLFWRLRGLGLMRGIELASPALGPLFTKAAYDEGLLSVYAYNDTRVAQLLPPLTADEALVHEILERADRALTRMETIAKGRA